MNMTSVVKALAVRREELNKELHNVDLALEALNSGRRRGRAVASRRASTTKKPRRVMDEATRAKIGRKMRRSWAIKRKQAKA